AYRKIHQRQEQIQTKPIFVRITRLWSNKKHQANKITTSFLCFDYQGHLNEGRFPTSNSQDSTNTLKEGCLYEISKFLVLPNFRKHKFSPDQCFIQITQQTTFKELEDINPNFPVHSFSPQNYNQLLRFTTTNTYLPGKSFIFTSHLILKF
ncbi:hypothetical protein N665_0103s0014, partial [Sinapis alba]